MQQEVPMRKRFDPGVLAGIGVLAALIVVNAVVSYRNTRQLDEDAHWVAQTHEVLGCTSGVLRTLVDAETGHRGFAVTGRKEFLEPYEAAVATLPDQLARLKSLMSDNPSQQERINRLEVLAAARLANISEGVALRQEKGFDAVQALIATGEGKRRMDAVRQLVDEMTTAEEQLLLDRQRKTRSAYGLALVTNLAVTALGLVMVAAFVWLLNHSLAARQRAATTLHEQRELFRTTLASIGDGVIATDTEGRITFLNPVAQDLTGWTAEAAAGVPLVEVFNIVNETTRQPVENPALRALQEGVIVGLANHTVLIARDGTERPIDDSAAPIRGTEKRILGVVLVFRDVTERRQTEELLRESEARFRQVADTMPQIVWVTRPDGYHEYYNRRWYDYIGCTPQECLGHGWNAPLHPDDRQRAIDRWNLALHTGEPYEVEYRFRSKEGEYRWFLGRALPVHDDTGRIIKWFGTCTDIEDFKRLEAERQKFVSLAENSTDFIGICDVHGQAIYVNQAGMRFVGLDSLEQVRGTALEDYFFPEDWPRVRDEFLPVVLRDGHGEIEIRFRHFKTGAAAWMLYTVFKVADGDGQTIGLATISRDITQRRQLENDLRQLAADLSEANRYKDEFLATLAHELRNPLAPIRNGLQILKLAGQNAQAIEQARTMMERQLAQMVRLVDDLLDVGRITRNKLELRKERVDLATAVANAVETSRPLIETNGHELTVSMPPTPIYVDADLTRLAQVFSNLLNNAAKYTERGGHIWLTVERQGAEVVAVVKDTGVGIPPGMLPKVFDMFTQVDRTLERAQGGLGIGLTLVRRLVEMHGGRVEARSEGYGHGSEFTVRLPVVPFPTGLVPDKDSNGGQPRLARRRILVVDDNEDSANSLSLLLTLMGNEVRVVHDGQTAVTAAGDFSPDVILLDIGLPRLNGYEACRGIRQQPGGSRPVIVACTGWGQDEDRRRSLEAGFNHHLVKPVDPEALEKLLAGLQIDTHEADSQTAVSGSPQR